MIDNKFMYGQRILKVDPVTKKKTLGDLQRHVIDTGADETYCGELKALYDNRSYSRDIQEGAEVCLRCHKENKKRHWSRAGIKAVVHE